MGRGGRAILDSIGLAALTLAVLAFRTPEGVLDLPQHELLRFPAIPLAVLTVAVVAIRLVLWRFRRVPIAEVDAARALVGASSILAGIALIPLWLPGLPVNQDLPLHVQKVWGCLRSHSPLLTTAWNPWLNGGRAPFQAYPILPFLPIFHLAPLLGFEPVLKGVLSLTLFVPAWAAHRFLSRLGALTAALGYALLLLQPGGYQFGGYSQLLIFGMCSSVLASGFLIWSLDRCSRYLEEPTRRNLAVLAVSAGLVLLGHIMQFAQLGLFLILAWLVVRPRLRTGLGVTAATVLGVALASFWFLPVVATHLGGIYINPFTESCGTTFFNWEVLDSLVLRTVTPWIWPLVGLGLFRALRERQRALRVVAASLAGVLGLWGAYLWAPTFYALTPWSRLMELERSLQEFRSLFLLLAAAGLGWPLTAWWTPPSRRGRTPGLAAAGALAIWMVVANAGGMLQQAGQQLNLNEELRGPYEVLYRLLPPEGRVLHQEVVGRVAGEFKHAHLENYLPLVGGREGIAFDGINMAEDLGGFGLEGLLERYDWDPVRLRELFQRWNVTAVVITTRGNHRRLDWLPVHDRAPPWTILATGIEPGYFRLHRGRLIDSGYGGDRAWVELETEAATELEFRMHDHPGWRAELPDGRMLTKLNRPGRQIRLQVPPGRHRIELRFGPWLADYLGYALSLAAAGLLFWLGLPRRRAAG